MPYISNKVFWTALTQSDEYSVIRCGFRGKEQTWFFAIWREYRDKETHYVNWAEVLFYI